MSDSQSIRVKFVDALADELGVLADIIFDEVLQEMKIRESDLTSFHAGKFVRILDQKIPGDLENRQLLIRNIGQFLMHSL